MKLLLTSAGIKNASIHNALVELLGKPIAESSALCIPTAGYGHPQVTPDRAWRFISGQEPNCPMLRAGLEVPGRAGADRAAQHRPGTLGIVDFSICPHLAPDGRPGNSMAEAEQWAAGIASLAYAIDDQTAIQVIDGTVEVVSEGHWKRFAPAT